MAVSTNKVALGNLLPQTLREPMSHQDTYEVGLLASVSVVEVHHIGREGFTTVRARLRFQFVDVSLQPLFRSLVAVEVRLFISVVVSLAVLALSLAVFVSQKLHSSIEPLSKV